MSLPDIANATGMTKSAAQRFAHTLLTLGYLRKDDASKRYSLTPKVIELGYRYLVVDRFLERTSPYALDLSRRCSETVNVAEADGTDMVYLARFSSPHHMPVHMPIGRRLPMNSSTAGRAYLSALPAAESLALLEQSPRVRYTQTTVTEVAELARLIDEARRVGYAAANAEYYEGDLGISVAIRNGDGRPLGVLNISCPALRWTLPRMRRELVPMLLETARLISTTPPPTAKVEPFLLGAGTITSGQANTILKPAQSKRSKP